MKLARHVFEVSPAPVGFDEIFRRAFYGHEHALSDAGGSREFFGDAHGVAVRPVSRDRREEEKTEGRWGGGNRRQPAFRHEVQLYLVDNNQYYYTMSY